MERQTEEENYGLEKGDRVQWLEHDDGFLWEAFGTVIEVKGAKTRVLRSYRYTQLFHPQQFQGLHKIDTVDTEKLKVTVKNSV